MAEAGQCVIECGQVGSEILQQPGAGGIQVRPDAALEKRQYPAVVLPPLRRPCTVSISLPFTDFLALAINGNTRARSSLSNTRCWQSSISRASSALAILNTNLPTFIAADQVIHDRARRAAVSAFRPGRTAGCARAAACWTSNSGKKATVGHGDEAGKTALYAMSQMVN